MADESRDVRIAAPPALSRSAPTRDEIIVQAELQGRDRPTEREIADAALSIAADAHHEAEQQKIAASTIANLCLSLAKKLIDKGHGLDGHSVKIERSLSERMKGGKLSIRETPDGDIVLEYRERAERAIEPEGRL